MEMIKGKEKGCAHSERPKVKRCYGCGEELCYECAMELVVGSRVVSFSSVDMVTQRDIGFFCPFCYLVQIYSGNAPIHKKPITEIRNFGILVIIFFGIFIPIAIGTGGAFVMIMPVVFTGICAPVWIWIYVSKKKAYTAFKMDIEKALKLLVSRKGESKPHRAEIPITTNTKACINCGKQIPIDTKFCTHCGATQIQAETPITANIKACINCGKQIPIDTKFCTHCGAAQTPHIIE